MFIYMIWNKSFMWLLVTIAVSQWRAIFEIGKRKNSSWTPWRAKGSFVPCGIPLPTCILLHNWAGYLCGWRGDSEWRPPKTWLTINVNLLMVFKWDISICSLLCCVFLLSIFKWDISICSLLCYVFLLLVFESGILNSIQCELNEDKR